MMQLAGFLFFSFWQRREPERGALKKARQ